MENMEHIINTVNTLLLNDLILILPQQSPINEKICTVFVSKLDNRSGIIIAGKQADELLYYYSLYAFTDKIIIGSLDLPHGRKLRNLLECGIATEEELINDVILGVM
ncbi:MAG: hypothetical protein LBD23_20455 [Oscillospiraceae bacterium]|jgi:hypothetical protein|nr:hypothetical protein [Oscillospiraceae bacterium]